MQGFAAAVNDLAIVAAYGIIMTDLTPPEVKVNPANTFSVWEPRLEELRPYLEKFFRVWAMATHAGKVIPEIVAKMCARQVPEEWENQAAGQALMDASFFLNFPVTEKYGDVEPDLWKSIQPAYIKAGEIEGRTRSGDLPRRQPDRRRERFRRGPDQGRSRSLGQGKPVVVRLMNRLGRSNRGGFCSFPWPCRFSLPNTTAPHHADFEIVGIGPVDDFSKLDHHGPASRRMGRSAPRMRLSLVADFASHATAPRGPFLVRRAAQLSGGGCGWTSTRLFQSGRAVAREHRGEFIWCQARPIVGAPCRPRERREIYIASCP